MGVIFKYLHNNVTLYYEHDNNPNPSNFTLHTHEAYELYCFLGGNAVYQVEGTPYPLKKGDILILRPLEAHYINLDCTIPYTRLYIYFRPELLDNIDPQKKLLVPYNCRENGTYNLYRAQNPSKSIYSFFIDRIITSVDDEGLQAITSLLSLLFEIYKAFKNIGKNEIEHSIDYYIINYINKHISEDISINKLCNEFFISESQLSRIFKKATNTTVWKYVTTKRLMNARQLILSGIPPTTVYSDCGFKDYSTFFRAYKKRYGVPPGRHELAAIPVSETTH